MKYLQYPLEQGRFVNRFLTTDTFCKPMHFKKAVLKGRVNEWLKYGFSIHENPCRQEFLADRLASTPPYMDLSGAMSGSDVTVFDTTKPMEVYFPFGNVNVERSRFYYTPTFLRTYSCTYLYSPQQHTADFTLCTCGGATIWVNGELACDYTPFTRNLRKITNVSLTLNAGINLITVCLDDLAERDTDYYFRLEYCGTHTLEIRVPVAEGADCEAIKAGEDMISTISFGKDVYLDEPVSLRVKNPFNHDIKLNISYVLSIVSGRIHKQESLVRTFERTLPQNGQEITVFAANEAKPSFYFLQIEVDMGGIRIGRKIGTQVFEQALLQRKDETIAQRKHSLLDYTCNTGIANVYRCAAEYTLGRTGDATEQTLLEELDGIEMRKDCSDFHFVVILCLYQKYEKQMSAKLRERIREVAINFRYWIDEPGDDVMWFFSENHALLFHICQYAAGTLFENDIFTTSGNTGKQQKQRAEALLEEWFTDFFREFITEWNSNAYIPVDTLGFGALYTFAQKDSALHTCAKKALDDVFTNLSIIAHKGAVVTTFGRSYEEQLKGNYVSGTTGLLYLGFNRGNINGGAMSYIMLALDDYEPPKNCIENLDLADGESLIFENTQGFESHVNLYLYKTNIVQLSTAVNFKAFQPGYQEHIAQACIDPVAQVFVNHPGESQPYGSGRPNYWAGNGTLPRGAQYKNTSVLLYDIDPLHLIDYTHVYFPTMHFDEVLTTQNVVAARKGDGYIGVYAQNGLSAIGDGPLQGREYRSPGKRNVWVLSVAESRQYETLAQFTAAMQTVQATLNEDNSASVRTLNGITLTCHKDGILFADGTQVSAYPQSSKGKITQEKGAHG